MQVPYPLIARLWDTYLAEGDLFPEFLVYVCASFMLTVSGPRGKQGDTCTHRSSGWGLGVGGCEVVVVVKAPRVQKDVAVVAARFPPFNLYMWVCVATV